MAPKDGKITAALPYHDAGGQWSIGVDFVGLARLADLLNEYHAKGSEVVESINKTIQEIAKDASWKGEAAKTFVEAWEKDTRFASKVGGFETGVADVLGELAVALAWIQRRLVERVDELARTVGMTNLGGNDLARIQALRNEQAEASQQASKLAQKAQKDAAGKLQKLYSGQTGGWSVIKALDTLEHNKYVSPELKKTLSKLEDDLDEQIPDNKSIFDKVIDSNTIKGIPAGAGVGALVGGLIGIAGGPPGIAAGATIGGVVGGSGGGIWGGLEDLF
ncbi:hypothetical protein [Actinomadura algeriensis]|uniref:Membrane protein n=1 Tax=Actinomadura algeriensis TaxID=1679523 RepID=A0ABR9JS25_9ACTN|nr:hypothetical protein [Actinomadura algeriensis]MBE1533346.1 putative membrane protein [Actinomadura algeriensis]